MKIILFTAALMTSMMAHAYSFRSTSMQHEVFASMTYGEINMANSNTNINAQGSYSYLLMKGIQVGADLGFTSVKVGSSSNSYMTLYATGTWNYPMDGDIREAMFVKGGIGMADSGKSSFGESKSEFGFKVFGGKRFPLWERMSFAPMAGYEKVGSADGAIVIIPLNIGFMW
jgi:hypothetical protein